MELDTMLDDLISQLNDDDPARRREAIVALGKSKNPAALRPLAEIYRSDPEPDLRELARKAGVYIRQQADAQPESPRQDSRRGGSAPPQSNTPRSPQPEEESYTQRRMRALEESRRKALEAAAPVDEEPLMGSEAASRRPIRGRKYNVPKENQERARKYVDAALTFNSNGDDAKAMKNLTEALSLDPNLINDAYFNSIATSVTGMDGDMAIDLIIDRGQRKQFEQKASNKLKQERIDKHVSVTQTTSWTDATWEIVVFVLIVTIGPVLQTLVAMQTSLNFFNTISGIEGAPEISGLATSLQSGLVLFTGATLIPVAFMSALIGVGGLALQLVLVHLMATVLFGGHGTMRHLLTVLLGFYNRWLPVLFLVSYIGTAVFFVSAGSPIAACFVIIVVVLSLYVLFNTSSKVGQAYDFGGLRGCLAVNLSHALILGVITVVTVLLLQAVGTAALQTFFQIDQALAPVLTPEPTVVPPV